MRDGIHIKYYFRAADVIIDDYAPLALLVTRDPVEYAAAHCPLFAKPACILVVRAGVKTYYL